jgi:hypothetical protein
MQKIKKFVIRNSAFVIVFMLLVMPAVSLAQPWAGLVPCGKTSEDPCGFTDIIKLVDGVIKFILYYMVIPIAAIMFAYAGFLMITGGGEAASARTRAKSIFTDALIGLIIAVAAFLIVKLLLSILGYEGPTYLE